MKNNIIPILVVIISLSLLATFIGFRYWNSSLTTETPTNVEVTSTSTQQSSSPSSHTSSTENSGAASTAPSQPKPAEQPVELTTLLQKNNLTFQQLESKNCRQLMVVKANGNQAQLSFYQQQNGVWNPMESLACNGFVGKNGMTSNKTEGDGCTPIGLYPLGDAFYTNAAPNTKLNAFQITQNSYWVDDPNSIYYNKYVVADGTVTPDWNSAEHMISYPGYQYGMVIEYNTACVKNKGSAIFFHIGSSYTAGCVATSQSMVLSYLSVLDPAQSPYILLTNG